MKPHHIPSAIVLLALLVASGCASIQKRLVSKPIDGVLQAIQSQPDPELVREGLPTMMLLVDGFIAANPDDPDLLRMGASLYTVYCQSFMQDEALLERSARLHDRAKDYALRLLAQHPTIGEAIAKPVPEFEAAVQQTTVADVPDLYAAGAAWLGWILSHSESMAAIAELPRAMALMERCLALDDTYQDGAAHVVFGIWFAARPRGAGQDIPRSKRHFERAIELGGDDRLIARVAYAEFIGKATLDEDFFESTLDSVVEYDVTQRPDLRLVNQLAQDRAAHLLETQEDYF